MKLILLGATGMVGGGVLREAIADPDIESILCVGRRSCGVRDPKLSELILPDLFAFASFEAELTGYDACIWTIGISSIGQDEASYAKITEQLTLLWARALLRLNPNLSFCYCSAAGAGGRQMWARVRQRAEGALEEMPFRHAGCVRPGFIQPAPGIRSQVKLYNVFIAAVTPIVPLLLKLLPSLATTSERLARAMLGVVKGKADRYILESSDINRLGQVELSRG